MLALVLTLFSAFESVSSPDQGPLWQHFGTRLAVDYASLGVVVLVVASAKWAIPRRLFADASASRAVALSFAPYTIAGVLGGIFRYWARLLIGVNWHVTYPLELLTNVGAGILTFTMVGFIASQYYPLMERLERLRALSAMAEQAADIANRRDFHRRLGQADRQDEIGYLARTVNQLLSTVEATLASHNDFLADISHELRNPLLALRLNLDTISRASDETAKEESVRECVQLVERMSRLVADLLTLSRLDAGQIIERRPLRLHEVMRSAARAAARQASGQMIEVGQLENVEILGDESRIRQVLANLLGNALRHTPPGGSIVLRLTECEGFAVLEVADTGEGIPPEHLPHVFERFYQVGRAGSDGAGLGLAIVKHLCEAHGGHVEVESQPGEGSRFTVWLPSTSHVPTAPIA